MKTNSIFSVFLFTLTASAVPAAHKPDTASTTLQSTETGSAEIGWALNSNETETSDLVGTDPIPILNPSAKRYFLKTHVHNHVRNRHLNNLYVALYPMGKSARAL